MQKYFSELAQADQDELIQNLSDATGKTVAQVTPILTDANYVYGFDEVAEKWQCLSRRAYKLLVAALSL